MNYKEYAPLALRTAKFFDFDMDLFHARLGIVTEVGELADCFKRHLIYGKPLDLANMKEEIGDIFWYVNLLWFVEGTKPPEQQLVGANYNPAKLDSATIKHFLFGLASDAAALSEGRMSSSYFRSRLEYLAMSYDLDIGECLDKNIAKLAARYGDKYSDYMALNRDLGKERVVLEGGV